MTVTYVFIISYMPLFVDLFAYQTLYNAHVYVGSTLRAQFANTEALIKYGEECDLR